MKITAINKILVIVASLSLAVGIGIGLALGRLIPGERQQERPHRGQLAPLRQEEADMLLSRCRADRRGNVSLLTRSNLHAAEAMLRLRKSITVAGPILTYAAGGGDPVYAFMVMAIQPGPHPSHVVLMCVDDEGRLLHYSHPVDSSGLKLEWGFGARLSWLPIKRGVLAGMGNLHSDGIIYVESTAFREQQDNIRIPDGEVAVGLRYGDGTYSNFIPLERDKSETPDLIGHSGGETEEVLGSDRD